jgi:hypothetical protein
MPIKSRAKVVLADLKFSIDQHTLPKKPTGSPSKAEVGEHTLNKSDN